MATFQRTCSSSHVASLGAIRALATVLGVASVVDFSSEAGITSGDDDDNNKFALELKVVVSNNPFGNRNSSLYHRGYVNVCRALCQMTPELGLWASPLVESWIESASSALVPVAYILSDDRVAKAGVQAIVTHLADSVERQLGSLSQTFLVGDGGPTAADVIVSVLLADACARTKSGVGTQTLRWMETILNNPLLQKVVRLPADLPTLDEGRPVEALDPRARILPFDVPGLAAEGTAVVPSETAPEKVAITPAAKEGAAAAAADHGLTYPAAAVETDTGDNVVLDALREAEVDAFAYDHTPCTTAEELVANVPLPPRHSHTKNLLFKDKKHGIFLVTARPSCNTGNTKALGQALNLTGKVNLRLADPKTLDEVLGAKPGCVGPLSILKDAEAQKVTLVLDEGLLRMDYVHSHPLRNDVSCAMKPDALLAFLKDVCKHEPVVITLDEAAAGTATAGTATAGAPATNKPKTAPAAAKKAVDKKVAAASGKKGETLLALQWKKETNFPEWYTDVITLSEMIGYYNISGCYILRPWSYKMWELIQDYLNAHMRTGGVENAYFPLFVSKDRLEREKDHVEGFAPEVAWVTKSGDGELAVPIAIRPTSETIMYPSFKDWIQSHRDLPLCVNQWSNVVRWEFKYPTPFLRSREFLWQEGHTVHATHDEANDMVMRALGWYKGVYEELLAVPVIPGYKTEKEKFAGGHRTTTVEAYIPTSGRAIQGATSHDLGQNFGRMFDISFQAENGKSQVPWQTSWGLTTRVIGVMVMVHGDDTGLIVPPRIAPIQCVIVPILSKNCPMQKLGPYCQAIYQQLFDAGIRVKCDDRDSYNPGWKYNHWEQKGVPLRLEVGPRDMEANQVRMVVRHDGSKSDVKAGQDLAAMLTSTLNDIQTNMLTKARVVRDANLVQVTEWKDFVPNLEQNHLVLTPWIGGEHQEWEEWVKDTSRAESLGGTEQVEDARTATSVAAKTLCIPFDQPDLPPGTKCIASGKPATCWVLWGRSY